MRTPELVCPGCVRVRLSCCEWSVEPAPVTASSSALRLLKKMPWSGAKRKLEIRPSARARPKRPSATNCAVGVCVCVRVCVSPSACASPVKFVIPPELFEYILRARPYSDTFLPSCCVVCSRVVASTTKGHYVRFTIRPSRRLCRCAFL